MSNEHDTTNPELPLDPVLRARYVAIRSAGGVTKVAQGVGLQNHESVSRWWKNTNSHPKPEQARKLVKLCGGVVTLQEILPSVYGGLTCKELGYTPEGAPQE
ncbi:hypothetical protein HXXDennis_49 [Xanthomonas phage HXX_Dennis]|nr:hypothetical protein [Stenotrophomonas phage StM171]QZI85851.1 immunity repressor [Stenotrophomonas phage Suso]TXH02763.1 MAG: hypothetical protein E6R07_14655 [Nevskiaceae bacterium]UTQ79936.1 hypothetical protein HXXDennis_49 [Xanthomonas phage HXX_Dennis]